MTLKLSHELRKKIPTIIDNEGFAEPTIIISGSNIIAVKSGDNDTDWTAYQVPRDVYVYIRQLECYIKNPKESKLKQVYDRRFRE